MVLSISVKYDQEGHLQVSDTWEYGLITVLINWLPGLVAAIHCVSTKRHEYGVKRTIKWALCLLIFYPFIPTLAFIALLWVGCKNQAHKYLHAINSC